MTPADMLTQINLRYNSTGDSFFSDSETYYLMWAACIELAVEGLLIEGDYSTTSVSGTRGYAFPSRMFSIKRVTYDGKKLDPITFRQDDFESLNNSATTATGTPRYYVKWNDTLYLRPTPDDAKTIEVFGYMKPDVITSVSTFEIGTEWHMRIIDYILSERCMKNKDWTGADRYGARWQAALQKVKSYQKMRKRGDGFTNVVNVDEIPETYLGSV